jgi:hypothetical protein
MLAAMLEMPTITRVVVSVMLQWDMMLEVVSFPMYPILSISEQVLEQDQVMHPTSLRLGEMQLELELTISSWEIPREPLEVRIS